MPSRRPSPNKKLLDVDEKFGGPCIRKDKHHQSRSLSPLHGYRSNSIDRARIIEEQKQAKQAEEFAAALETVHQMKVRMETQQHLNKFSANSPVPFFPTSVAHSCVGPYGQTIGIHQPYVNHSTRNMPQNYPGGYCNQNMAHTHHQDVDIGYRSTAPYLPHDHGDKNHTSYISQQQPVSSGHFPVQTPVPLGYYGGYDRQGPNWTHPAVYPITDATNFPHHLAPQEPVTYHPLTDTILNSAGGEPYYYQNSANDSSGWNDLVSQSTYHCFVEPALEGGSASGTNREQNIADQNLGLPVSIAKPLLPTVKLNQRFLTMDDLDLLILELEKSSSATAGSTDANGETDTASPPGEVADSVRPVCGNAEELGSEVERSCTLFGLMEWLKS
ncbi:hypothetical protein RvY_08466 [Ramazzottius varieornatus]|uniref:Uncharacterized protein n=1 Tax=Ramazzottius varieornatus TaxID=947166 RepID=A0A1D1VE04_RAMVA|nr:hypothetical protein RvY_08466 [Ramazzottius varieornatus]